MTQPSNESIGKNFYQKGKAYSLSQESSPAAATLARAAFLQGATLNDTASIRALADMNYYGRGGEKNIPEALRLLWIAFLAKDRGALSELSDMLEDLADVSTNPSVKLSFGNAAIDAQEVFRRLQKLDQFLRNQTGKDS